MKIYDSHALFLSPHIVLETHRLQHLFSEESLNQGRHFDAPESVSYIPHFIKTYQLDLTELLVQDLTKYECFNAFFYRKLMEGARVIADRDDPVNKLKPPLCGKVNKIRSSNTILFQH